MCKDRFIDKCPTYESVGKEIILRECVTWRGFVEVIKASTNFFQTIIVQDNLVNILNFRKSL